MAGTWAYLAGKQNCRGHLLHSQVPDAGRQGAPARRAAAQLLAALVTHQVPGLALQDGGQDIVKANRALEERGQLVVLRKQDERIALNFHGSPATKSQTQNAEFK